MTPEDQLAALKSRVKNAKEAAKKAACRASGLRSDALRLMDLYQRRFKELSDEDKPND